MTNRIIIGDSQKMAELLQRSGIKCYDTRGRQVPQIKLDSGATSGDHLEFDLFAKIGKVGLIIESTTQKADQRQKIGKFCRHCSIFINSPVQLDRRLQFFGLSKSKRDELDDVEKWMTVYIGTSNELIGRFTPPITPSITLKVLNAEHLEYLRFLTGRIGKYAKFEISNMLGISSQDADESGLDIRIQPIIIRSRKISNNMGLCDLYLFEARVLDLLRIARVVRYGSPNEPVHELGTEAYQRLLSQKELRKIQEYINKEKAHTSFPNAITIVLSKLHRNPNEEGEWVIPVEYGSVEVIDGQHRLFAFAESRLTENQLHQCRLPVVGVKFRDESKGQQWAARTFVDINREQTRVPSELVALIANKVMGETVPTALAARVLIELNVGETGPLANVFKTRPFLKKNRVGAKPVRLVTITNELSRLFTLSHVFSVSLAQPLSKTRSTKAISEAKQIVGTYFSHVSSAFNNDWKSGASLLLSAKYLSAFCRLLVDFKGNGLTDQQIWSSLDGLKSNILTHLQNSSTVSGPRGELLHNRNNTIPHLRSGLQDIQKFLDGHIKSCTWSSTNPYA
jgi:DGQHR domain-containing protein